MQFFILGAILGGVASLTWFLADLKKDVMGIKMKLEELESEKTN